MWFKTVVNAKLGITSRPSPIQVLKKPKKAFKLHISARSEHGAATGSEREIDAEIDRSVGAKREPLFGELAKRMIHAEEHVESCHLDAGHPSEGASERAYGDIGAGRETPYRLDVVRQPELRPAVMALDASGIEQAERQPAVDGQRLFCIHSMAVLWDRGTM